MSWRDAAACRDHDPDLFFPGIGESRSKARRARLVCESCPVQTQCLEYALSLDYQEDAGIWAGTSVDERRMIRHGRLVEGPDSFGARIGAAIKAAGYQQYEVAELMGVDPASVSNWQSNRRRPSEANLRRLEEVLKIEDGRLMAAFRPNLEEAS